MGSIIWSQRAADDLEEIFRFISRDSPAVAAIFVSRLYAVVGRLADFPRSGRTVPEIGQDDFREVVVEGYRIIYSPDVDDVRVLRIMHGARVLQKDDIDD